MCREFPGCRVIRAEGLAGFQVNDAKLHGQQNVFITGHVFRQVAVVVVRHGGGVIHRHGEGVHQLGNPRCPGDFGRIGRQNTACQERQKQGKNQK